jgi:hypothetical protein
LPISEPGDRVARRASARVARAEADEEAAGDNRDEALDRQQGRPAEQLARDQAGQIVQAECRQCLAGVRGDCDLG